MYTHIVEKDYYLSTCTSKARLSPLNLYCYLAIEDAIVQVFCSETYKIADETLVR